MKKRIIAMLLALFIVVSAIPAMAAGSLSNFKKVNNYTDKTFSDVSSSNWFSDNVRKSYELGLFLGIGGNKFVPRGDISILQTITVACRIHKIYNEGNSDFEKTTPWYTAYMDYAVKNGIVKRGEFTNLEKSATRAQFAYILANALPMSEYNKINSISRGEIPDVSGSEYFADAVYALYNAGIIIGSDDYGTFAPNTPIERSAVAAIATRMADKNVRLKASLKPSYVRISTDYFSVAFPSAWRDICNVSIGKDRISFYEKASQSTFYGGHAFTIFASDDPDQIELGNDFGHKAGTIVTADGKMLYVYIQYPSDVQYDYDDADITARFLRISNGGNWVLSTIEATKGGVFNAEGKYTNWRDAYNYEIKHMRELNKGYTDDMDRYREYGLYDIDNDGTPELFVRYGVNEAYSLWYVYKYYEELSSAENFLRIDGGNRDICGVDGENAFYLHYSHLGLETITKYTITGPDIIGSNVYDGKFGTEGHAALKEIDIFDINSDAGLNWTANNDGGNRNIAENL